MSDDGHQLYRDGRLADAVAAQTAAVRAAPTAIGERWFLAELLCFCAEYERADRMLDVIATQAPDWGPAAAVFRRLLRGEEIRRQVLRDGRAPQLGGAGMAALQPVAEALMLLRLGEAGQAMERLGDADAALPGSRNGTAFAEFRDLDDVFARLFELITPDGGYCWVMARDVARLALRPLSRPRDLIWRQAEIEMRGGISGEVWLPALYVPPNPVTDDALRLGRRTDWIEEPGTPVRGLGLRSYLVDDDDVPIHELGAVSFAAAPP